MRTAWNRTGAACFARNRLAHRAIRRASTSWRAANRETGSPDRRHASTTTWASSSRQYTRFAIAATDIVELIAPPFVPIRGRGKNRRRRGYGSTWAGRTVTFFA
jgi:hypothetical protein